MLKNPYKIVHSKEYNAKRIMVREWWEAHCFKTRFLFFKRWWPETETVYDSGGGHQSIIRFNSEEEAFKYIERVSMDVPKETVIRKECYEYI